MAEAVMWYYESEGRQSGPVPEPALVDLVRAGRVAGDARVWRAGMPDWQPVQRVPELASALPPQPVAAEATPVAAPLATTPPRPIEPVRWGPLVALTIVTFGIYGVVRYYQAARAYEALAGRASRFTTWFWLYVGLGVTGFLAGVAGGPVGFVAGVASLVFGVLSLLEAIGVRGEALRRAGLSPPLTADGTHRALTIAAAATSWAGVGVILAIVEGVFFFQDHDAIARALAGRATTPVPQGRLCRACGHPLALDARFCDRCGAPATG